MVNFWSLSFAEKTEIRISFTANANDKLLDTLLVRDRVRDQSGKWATRDTLNKGPKCLKQFQILSYRTAFGFE